MAIPNVHAAENNTIQLALVGCGGRGSGAAGDALSVPTELGPTKLVAMADVFPNRLSSSYGHLQEDFEAAMDVPDDRKFIGFEVPKWLSLGLIVVIFTGAYAYARRVGAVEVAEDGPPDAAEALFAEADPDRDDSGKRH